MKTKICRTCKKERTVEDFYKLKDALDGRYSDYKVCYCRETGIYSRLHSKEVKAYHKIYDMTHKEEDRLYRKLHSKEIRKRTDDWLCNHPDKDKIYGAKRSALKRNAPGHFTSQEWIDLCDKYGNICLCCRKKKKLTVDHIVPLSKGGSNYILNIQPLCKHCNCVKGTQTIDYRPKENV